MFQDQVVAGSLESVMRFLVELNYQVSGSHTHSMVTLTWVCALVAGVHAWFDVDVLGDNNHFLPDTIIHDNHLFKADAFLTAIVEFFKGAVHVNS
jgi:hypothetical protein